MTRQEWITLARRKETGLRLLWLLWLLVLGNAAGKCGVDGDAGAGRSRPLMSRMPYAVLHAHAF
jgi:hypothetical protein